jgi:hypothetical protein
VTITSYPFDNQSITETDYSRLFREFQTTGVADSLGGTSFYTYGDGSGMTVKVSPGFAIVRGHAVYSTATEVLTTPPALTQTDTGVWEFPLATVTVGANVTSIAASAVQGERKFLGNTVGAWTTSTRPTANLRVGRLGYNSDTKGWEFWDGTAWKDLSQAVSWSTVDGKPATFPPSPHSHVWADITDKPTTFAPSSHSHDWNSITSKPTTFAPSTHSHSWSSITSKPSTFTPSSHSHSNYLESGDTISWANGSQRVRNDSVSGSGTYYAVWVQGDDKFAKNTSSRRYKTNIREYVWNPEAVYDLRPVIYDRIDGNPDEYGLIAEEVNEVLPELTMYDDEGQIDALRYDLIPVAMIGTLRMQRDQIAALEARLAALEAKLS